MSVTLCALKSGGSCGGLYGLRLGERTQSDILLLGVLTVLLTIAFLKSLFLKDTVLYSVIKQDADRKFKSRHLIIAAGIAPLPGDLPTAAGLGVVRSDIKERSVT